MNEILVPCDFSRPAMNAFRLALDIASQSKGNIHLLHVIELPNIHEAAFEIEEQLLDYLKENAQSNMSKIVEKYRANEVKVTMIVRYGAVFKTINEYIKEASIDLVAMGSHGASTAQRFLIGSTTEKLVQHLLPVPVLVTRDTYKRPIRNIVFPNSLDPDRQKLLSPKLKMLQNFLKARLHLVWINTPYNFTSDTITNVLLQKFASQFMFKNYTTSVFNSTEEERGVFDFANTVNADLIVFGPQSKKGILRVINETPVENAGNDYREMAWAFSIQQPKAIGA